MCALPNTITIILKIKYKIKHEENTLYCGKVRN